MKVGEDVWVARRKYISDATVAEYEKPIKYTTRFNYLTIMPASSRGLLERTQHGEAVFSRWTGIANGLAFIGKIAEGDVMWVDGAKPDKSLEEKYGYGCTANAIVVSALPVNHTISLVLETNREQVKE